MLTLLTEWFADAIAIVHAAVLLLYVGGAVSVLCGGFSRVPLMFWQRIYLVLVLIISFSVLFTDQCCLTQLENAIRSISQPDKCYDCTYIKHYVASIPESVDTIASILLLFAGCMGTLTAFWNWSHSGDIGQIEHSLNRSSNVRH